MINEFPLQWHITVKCDQNCKHCYMRDEEFYENQLKNPLSYEDIIKIIDMYLEFTDEWSFRKRIIFTGGDPLLRSDFFDILKYTKEKDIPVDILGNPFHLNESIVEKLEKLGVVSYQLSIDGMRETHDSLRSKGSFDDTMRAIKLLKRSGIKVKIMFTISKKNEKDLLDVIDLVARLNVDLFAFTRLIPIGSGESLKKYVFTDLEYRSLLLKVIEKYRELKEKGFRTYFGRKSCDPWILLERDLGLLLPEDLEDEEKNLFLKRCPIGKHLCILADGIVLSCRKLPIPIGKLPEQNFEEIINSKKMKYIMEDRGINRKKNCKRYVRGCAAMSYALTGDIRNPDPNCWC
ncbi:MAG: radical SAM protein [Candidatus Aenigmarchaeota archaeon]|nr:radical SAM protein [Candidatus Aenigmarchaeota archaeon]